jgi:hypothetical protein
MNQLPLGGHNVWVRGAWSEAESVTCTQLLFDPFVVFQVNGWCTDIVDTIQKSTCNISVLFSVSARLENGKQNSQLAIYVNGILTPPVNDDIRKKQKVLTGWPMNKRCLSVSKDWKLFHQGQSAWILEQETIKDLSSIPLPNR